MDSVTVFFDVLISLLIFLGVMSGIGLILDKLIDTDKMTRFETLVVVILLFGPSLWTGYHYFSWARTSDQKKEEERVAYQKAWQEGRDKEETEMSNKGCKRNFLAQRYGTKKVWVCPDGNQFLSKYE